MRLRLIAPQTHHLLNSSQLLETKFHLNTINLQLLKLFELFKEKTFLILNCFKEISLAIRTY